MPVATLRTRRAGVLVREHGKPVAEVVLDSVAVLDGRKVKRRFREVEVELVGAGDERVLERLATVLARMAPPRAPVPRRCSGPSDSISRSPTRRPTRRRRRSTACWLRCARSSG